MLSTLWSQGVLSAWLKVLSIQVQYQLFRLGSLSQENSTTLASVAPLQTVLAVSRPVETVFLTGLNTIPVQYLLRYACSQTVYTTQALLLKTEISRSTTVTGHCTDRPLAHDKNGAQFWNLQITQ